MGKTEVSTTVLKHRAAKLEAEIKTLRSYVRRRDEEMEDIRKKLGVKDMLLARQSETIKKIENMLRGDCRYCTHNDGLPRGMNNEHCRRCFRAWPDVYRADLWELGVKESPPVKIERFRRTPTEELLAAMEETREDGIDLAEIVEEIMERENENG